MINLLIPLLVVVFGCGKAPTLNSPSKEIVWPPRTGKHNTEAAKLPNKAQVAIGFSETDPFKQEGMGDIDENFNTTPREGSYHVQGTLVTKIGEIKKEARITDWAFIHTYPKNEKTKVWGYYITSGEMLIPKSLLMIAPPDMKVDNLFECEDFGDDFILIRLDPTKGHKLCLIGIKNVTVTAGFIGSKVGIEGTVIERKLDGWYSQNKKIGT